MWYKQEQPRLHEEPKIWGWFTAAANHTHPNNKSSGLKLPYKRGTEIKRTGVVFEKEKVSKHYTSGTGKWQMS